MAGLLSSGIFPLDNGHFITEPIESTWEQEYMKGVYIALGIVLFLMIVVIIGVLYRRSK